MKLMIKKSIVNLFNILGFEVSRKKISVSNDSSFINEQMMEGLKRISSLNLKFNTIIDVGAASGYWSLMAVRLWPNCKYLLFEPLTERKEELIALCRKFNNFHFVPSAAGKSRGKLPFFVSSDLDGSGVSSDSTINNRLVDLTTISDEVGASNFNGPYFIKLDTHGFEIPIIEGCHQILNDVSLFIIECYGFNIAKDSLLFWQMCMYMDTLGFRLFDIVDIMHRKKDGAFWQCDAIFIRRSHPVFIDNSYE